MSKSEFTLIERMEWLLSSGHYADVHFSVGEGNEKELLPALKVILASASDVFEEMFYSVNDEHKKIKNIPSHLRPVAITDIEVGAFKAMLRFIYTEDLSGLNGDNALSVLYAAKKFCLPGLVKACVLFPISKLRNVFLALQQAHFCEEKEFARLCLDYIDQNADSLITSDSFLQIDIHLLCKILERNQLQIEEITIWNAALRWADEQCRQRGKECSPENRREMLGPALFKIRFPLVPSEEFPKNIAVCGILTSDELLGVLLNRSLPIGCAQPALYPLLFPTQQRKGSILYEEDGDDGDDCKKSGKIILKIEKLSKFGEGNDTERTSKAVYIRGLPWKIVVLFDTDESFTRDKCCLLFFLLCDTEKHYANFRCECTATLRVIAQKAEKKDSLLGGKNRRIIYSNSHRRERFSGLMYQDLVYKNGGWYNEEEDTVILVADLIVDEPNEIDN